MKASSIRRNTYVLGGSIPDSTKKISKIESERSRIDKQNIMRLKINRIALVQEIKVEHIVPLLREKGVLTTGDRQTIMGGSIRQDKARILIDLLPLKSKETDWYKHFREALLEAPVGSEVKQRYQLLVDFLDNTFIPPPSGTPLKISNVDSNTEALSFPKYDVLPNIETNDHTNGTSNPNSGQQTGTSDVLNLEGKIQNGVASEDIQANECDEENGEKGILDDFPENKHKIQDCLDFKQEISFNKPTAQQKFQKPENFNSMLDIPESLLDLLNESGSVQDQSQIQYERNILEKAQDLEIVFELSKRGEMSTDFEISTCDALNVILDSRTQHSFVKYFKILKDLPRAIIKSYSSVLRKSKSTESKDMIHILSQGHILSDFFLELNCFADAEELLSLLLQFLDTRSDLSNIFKFKTLVKMMKIRNRDYNFTGVENAYRAVLQNSHTEATYETDVIEEGDLLIELSRYQLEKGLLNVGCSWAENALQKISPANYIGIVNGLCNAVIGYCSTLQIHKAKIVAIEAVSQARSHFGENHPLYLKSLLCILCYTQNNGFTRNNIPLEIAQKTLKVAMKMYGCDCLQVALSHRAMSKVLMMIQKFDNDEYYQHAMEGVRIARSIFPSSHPILHKFLQTFASALQWKGVNGPGEELETSLIWAATDGKEALKIAQSCYGEISLRTSHLYCVLGQIYSKMNRLEEAEQHFLKCISNMKLCQPPSCHYHLQYCATLGVYYKLQKRFMEAIRCFNEVIHNIDTHNHYIWWVHTCYQNLLSCYSALNDTQSVEDVQKDLEKWLEQNQHDDNLCLDNVDKQVIDYSTFVDKLIDVKN